MCREGHKTLFSSSQLTEQCDSSPNVTRSLTYLQLKIPQEVCAGRRNMLTNLLRENDDIQLCMLATTLPAEMRPICESFTKNALILAVRFLFYGIYIPVVLSLVLLFLFLLRDAHITNVYPSCPA